MPAIPALAQLLDAGQKLISEHASAAALRDHLALVNAQLKVAIDENERLKKRVAELESLSSSLAGEIKARAVGQDFEEESGVLFKRHTRGGYHKVPYSPVCKNPLGSLDSSIPYSCTEKCGFVSSVREYELTAIIKILPP